MEKALGTEHWQDYCQCLQLNSAELDIAQEARSSLREYIDMLKVADLQFGNSERWSNNYPTRQLAKSLKSSKMRSAYLPLSRRNDGQSYYEKALERLDELIAANPAIEQYLDRPWDYTDIGGGSLIDASKERVPRINPSYTSKSKKYTTRQLKIKALNNAISCPVTDATAAECQPDTEINISDLKALAALMRR